MTPIIFSTEGLPKAQQLDAWRGWFDTIFDLEVDGPRQGFSATSETWDFGGFGLTRVRAPKLRALRTASLIRRNPIDHWGVAFGYQRTLGETGKRGALDVPANTPYVASFGRPLISEREADERLQLYLPRDGFPELSAVLEAAEGRPLGGQMGQLLSEFIALMARTASALSNMDSEELQTAVRGMLLACVAPSVDHSVMADAPIAATRREVVRRLVDLHLNNPALGPDFLCREAGMSRSQLYRLFENEGGVAHYVQRRRLRRCFTELSRNAGGRSIAAIAEQLGFPDPSSFSRSFRREFGLTPRDVMYSRQSGAPVETALAKALVSETPNLHDLLRQIARD
ncbi:helix-turn-helix domain-containing protein [Bosea sp. MMO-172]|uniref:helix-turn-helix domain-containing protein n=1 Tax=Bosea sp. MMO-172 TaxID=3127885 RepID=UPI0030197782